MGKQNSLGFFFGAGAEVDYGFPNGSEFAVNIINPCKEVLSAARKDYEDFGFKDYYGNFLRTSSVDFRKICESMVENRESEIKKMFLQSDEDFRNQHKNENTETIFDDFVKSFTEEIDFPDFSLLSKAIEIEENITDDKSAAKKALNLLLGFNISLIFFLYGKKIASKINEKFLKEQCYKFLTDSRGFFLLDKKIALSFSNELFALINDNKTNLDVPDDEERIVLELKKLTKEILDRCFDYQRLFENFDSVFCPEKNRNQFRKIVSLLLTMRQIIIQKQKDIDGEKSYYDDILSDNNIKIGSICTTNYSTFYDEKFKSRCGNVFHLNGSIDSFFDIKNMCISNDVVNQDLKSGNIIPFLYPQVALKPVMYFDVVKLYSDAYKSLSGCSKIAVLGFGFNQDDNLLNGMFRWLLKENPGLEIVYYSYVPDEILKSENYSKEKSKKSEKDEIVKRLKIADFKERFQVREINKKHLSGGRNWLETLKEDVRQD